MTYLNDNAQLDTYWRPLPKTDDPGECMEHLLDWWRSRRYAERVIAGVATYNPHQTDGWNRRTAEAMLMAEREAIETLLDALAGTEAP